MSQGVLQAIFEYQTAICELTGMDVSNASGYDGATVAADACFVAKHATGSDADRRHRGDESAGAAGREDVRAGVRARGRRGSARGRRRPIRTASRAGAGDAAAVIFQQPNFFGCLEPAPRAGSSRQRGRRAAGRARRPRLARRARGARRLRLRARDRRGPVGRQRHELRRPALRLPRRRGSELIRRAAGPDRRRDGRRRGRARLRPHAPDARAAHPAREGDVEHHAPTRRCSRSAGWSTSAWLGPQGLRELGETCLALAGYAKARLDEAGLELAFPDSTRSRSSPSDAGRDAREVIQAARATRRLPGLPARPRLRGPRRLPARRA